MSQKPMVGTSKKVDEEEWRKDPFKKLRKKDGVVVKGWVRRDP